MGSAEAREVRPHRPFTAPSPIPPPPLVVHSWCPEHARNVVCFSLFWMAFPPAKLAGPMVAHFDADHSQYRVHQKPAAARAAGRGPRVPPLDVGLGDLVLSHVHRLRLRLSHPGLPRL